MSEQSTQLRALLVAYRTAEREVSEAERSIEAAKLARDAAVHAKRSIRDDIGRTFGWPIGATDGVLKARVDAILSAFTVLEL